MPKPIRLRVWGDLALFSRPELKVERYSYDVITPSAARGIFDAIYYHPGLRWVIKKIYVQKPIRFTNIRRNEVGSKILASSIYEAVRGGKKPQCLVTTKDIVQRASTVLRDVSYVIEANFITIPEKMYPEDSEEKFYAIFSERARKGKHFTQPYFGCREFTAFYEPYESEVPPVTINDNCSFGLMLYDMDYSDPENIRPTFFRAEMKSGVIDLSGCEVLS